VRKFAKEGEDHGTRQFACTVPEDSVTEALLRRIAGDPYEFWREFYYQKFVATKELNIQISALPRIGAKISDWIDDGSLLPIFIPTSITQYDYPYGWIHSDWGRHINPSAIKRCPLLGRWVVVELIRKPDWNDPEGYGNGDDRLARELSIQSRFKTSWDRLHATLCQQTANLWGLKNATVRPLTAEEWNFFGNVLLELNRLHGAQFPNLGATVSWEWAENACGSGCRVIVGRRGHGGLASVSGHWSCRPDDSVGFRLLGVL